jgi:hypothetical protein
MAINLILMPSDGFCQVGPPSPCDNYCFTCSVICSAECPGGDPNFQCLDCVLDNCEGPDIPISDYAGVLLAGGLIMCSLYFIRRSKLVLN